MVLETWCSNEYWQFPWGKNSTETEISRNFKNLQFSNSNEFCFTHNWILVFYGIILISRNFCFHRTIYPKNFRAYLIIGSPHSVHHYVISRKLELNASSSFLWISKICSTSAYVSKFSNRPNFRDFHPSFFRDFHPSFRDFHPSSEISILLSPQLQNPVPPTPYPFPHLS